MAVILPAGGLSAYVFFSSFYFLENSVETKV